MSTFNVTGGGWGVVGVVGVRVGGVASLSPQSYISIGKHLGYHLFCYSEELYRMLLG